MVCRRVLRGWRVQRVMEAALATGEGAVAVMTTVATGAAASPRCEPATACVLVGAEARVAAAVADAAVADAAAAVARVARHGYPTPRQHSDP